MKIDRLVSDRSYWYAALCYDAVSPTGPFEIENTCEEIVCVHLIHRYEGWISRS